MRTVFRVGGVIIGGILAIILLIEGFVAAAGGLGGVLPALAAIIGIASLCVLIFEIWREVEDGDSIFSDIWYWLTTVVDRYKSWRQEIISNRAYNEALKAPQVADSEEQNKVRMERLTPELCKAVSMVQDELGIRFNEYIQKVISLGCRDTSWVDYDEFAILEFFKLIKEAQKEDVKWKYNM